jgi:hypothetical protein
MASWTGTTPFATKKQLVSSISGLYADLQDLSGFQFQNLTVSTLTASQFISTPLLYVSDIRGYRIDISGISAATASFNLVNVSSLGFAAPSVDSLLKVNVDFNVGDIVQGALIGTGALLFETLVGVGIGAGATFIGIGNGIAAMINSKDPTNPTYINTNNYEVIGGSTQLQVSTLGQPSPPIVAYSSIMRYVSSISPNQVPGVPMFTSTLFYPGQTCIRSISDPYPLVTGNPAAQGSTIQQFGEWVPIPFEELVSTFTNLTVSDTTQNTLLQVSRNPGSNAPQALIRSDQTLPSSNFFPFPYTPIPLSTLTSKVYSHRDEYLFNNTFISTPYYVFQSTITADIGLVFIRSTVQTPSLYTYSNTMFIGDFAICEPDETGFRSTATMDFVAQGNDLYVQWGTLTDNRNSTIAAGTGKRVTWDNTANTSNFIDIPAAQSTVVIEATQQIFELLTTPYEIQVNTGLIGQPSQIAFNVQGATFGSNTTLNNQSNYPYQFNGNVYINGTVEAQTVIAISSIFATSTFVDTSFSTQSFEANTADILNATIDTGDFRETTTKDASISTLRATPNSLNDYITSLSRHRFAGYQTPISIITGKGSNLYDTTARFDFNTDSFPQAVYLESQPANRTLMYIFSTNIEIPNLTVDNLTANNIIYSNADVPNLQTSTITFGWTGDFGLGTPPLYSLNQILTTESGLVYNTYAAASNQVLNIMNFDNTVTMLAQQFSTPLAFTNTSFSAANRDGWASTIFTNADTVFKRVNLVSGAGQGELSLQGGAGAVAVSLNTVSEVGSAVVPVPVGSTYKFTCDGTTWTTLSNAPVPGVVQYNNNLNLTMDFENTTLTTADTLNINAEQINLNGIVTMENSQFSNIFVNNFVSTSQLIAPASFTGSWTNQPSANPIILTNTITSTDFTNIKTALNPVRGFNAFNSVNFNEWNNTTYNIDINAASGLPTMILGDLIIKSPSFTPYAGQFFINNIIDSPASNIPLYVNRLGSLSSIGVARSNQFTRVFTSNGTNWSIQSNVSSPSVLGPYTYSNFYTMSMNSERTLVQVGQPLIEQTTTKTMTTSKLILDTPAIRVNTIASPSFPSKESGFEFNTYFDATVVFTGTQSDAVNPIPNALNNYFFSVAGWSPNVSISRIRTQNTIQGYDIAAIVMMYTGTTGDFIWASARYLNVALSPAGEASIRENYFMTPKNYHTGFGFVGQ